MIHELLLASQIDDVRSIETQLDAMTFEELNELFNDLTKLRACVYLKRHVKRVPHRDMETS